MAMETSTSGVQSSKKNQGKVPKRIHKAEREKMKREHLNELFLSLTNSLELSDQNSGQASVLNEATRVVKDMLAEIECLKRENAALLSESQYVSMEKKELKDENSALADQIAKLQAEYHTRVSESQIDLNVEPPESLVQELAPHTSDGHIMLPPILHQGQIVNPLHLAPFCFNIQSYPEFSAQELASGNVAVVSKPHARYPTSADAWPAQLLEKQNELGK